MNSKITGIVGESVTFATGNLVRSFNKPYGATGLEIRLAALANDGWNFTPTLRKAWKFTAVGSVYRDDTDALRERGTNQTATYNSMVATNDFIYVGCDVPFRGVYVNVVNANGTASVLSAFYWKNDSTWAGLTETDGTASGGATLAIDNAITWTVPTDWDKTTVNGSGPHYWVRFNSDGGTDSATSLAEIIPMPVQPSVSTVTGGSDSPVVVATAVAAPRYWFDPNHVGGVEVTAANTEVIRMEWLVTSPTTALFVQ
jgi:hypothetical protein